MPTNEQSKWVERVLGVAMPQSVNLAASAPSGPRPKLLPLWIDAKEDVDAGIGNLQAALKATQDEDLLQIVEYGLYGATTGQAVRLMAALRDADASNDPAALKKLSGAVASYREFLAGAPIVDLIEDNPFGVTVPLRRVLGGALDELERQIAA